MEAMIEACCKQLKIGSTFYKAYKDIQAATHEQFLLALLEKELENREIVRKNRLLKTANFDVPKTFQDYIWEQIQIPPAIDIEAIKTVKFVEKKENLILYGSVGTGKSHLATAIGVEACNQGKQVKFYRTASLVNQLTDAKANGELKRFLRQIEKCELLICDEWGYVPFEKNGAQLLFQAPCCDAA